ncbi:MAG: agmatinase [Candidatus Marsarchaeota archaeon]|nr:agmatinase [Candidatus Marsarchaeota archaeon]MCL5106007.1 agmatinase [Candidatus Marsarchaeota archaeon]
MKILHSLPPYTLFGCAPKYEEAKIIVLPVPYDSTASYKAGARDGPHEIISASRVLEPYNEELDIDINDISIYTTEELEPDVNSPKAMANRIEKEVDVILQDKKIPIILGGDHAVSIGAVNSAAKFGKDFTYLHFDAHSDSRNEYSGSNYSHACVVARVDEVAEHYSVGVRSIQKEGMDFCKSILFRKDMHGMSIHEISDIILKNTKSKIYLSVDFDVLDPSQMPSTGTPEPDGLSFYELKEILNGVLSKKQVVGMDFAELSPIPGLIAPNVLAAKLIYFAIGYAFNKDHI